MSSITTRKVRAALGDLVPADQTIYNNKRAYGRTVKVYLVNPRNRVAIAEVLQSLCGYDIKFIRSRVMRRKDCKAVMYSVSAKF